MNILQPFRSHAGAIVSGDKGSYASKRRALEDAGARVVDTPGEIVGAVRAALQGRPARFSKVSEEGAGMERDMSAPS